MKEKLYFCAVVFSLSWAALSCTGLDHGWYAIAAAFLTALFLLIQRLNSTQEIVALALLDMLLFGYININDGSRGNLTVDAILIGLTCFLLLNWRQRDKASQA